MEAVGRGCEPPELARYRALSRTDPNRHDWNSVEKAARNAVRNKLAAMQRWCCAYCGQELIPDSDQHQPLSEVAMVEHIHPRNEKSWEPRCARGVHDSTLGYDDVCPETAWLNFLLCCRTSEGSVGPLAHCDKAKREIHCCDLLFPDSPAFSSMRGPLVFLDDYSGEVSPLASLPEPELEPLRILIDVLNLNASPLCRARLAYVSALTTKRDTGVAGVGPARRYPWLDSSVSPRPAL
jgi:uncharacterized protein (TIGR02646 family)